MTLRLAAGLCGGVAAVVLSCLALAPGAGAATLSGGGAPPTIVSDQPDYPPGATVTLTGTNWVAGDVVHIVVDDSTGHTWSHTADVTAAADGTIVDQFQLPSSFVANYSVVATGPLSGTATTSFTDSSIMVHGTAPAPATWTVNYTPYSTTNCSGTPGTSGSLTASGTGSANFPGNVTGAKITSTTVPGGWMLDHYDSGTNSADGGTSIGTTPCLSGGSVNGWAHFVQTDTTPPTSSATAGSYASGTWTNQNVTVAIAATDNTGGSGVQSITYSATGAQPIASTTVSGASVTLPAITTAGTTTISFHATDVAGNVESPDKTFVVQIDKTAPTITFTSRTAANANGWNNTNIVVNWSCADALSGPVATSVSVTVSTEGANQSATGTCIDQAGNTASNTQTGINVDKTAPTIAFSSRTAANANGWNNTNVVVNWSCADALSGAASASVNQTVSTEGANQSAIGTCSDLAGNSASNTQSSINIDKTAPTITFTTRTAANANGWNNTNVVVNWSCADALSGAASASVSQTVTTEGANQSATGTCSDLAGNSASNTQSGIKIDKTAPAITFSSRTAANANGWNNTNVVVNWSCADTLSGPTSASVSQTVSTEGANQSATGLCTDLAGNAMTNTQSSINIDKTAPTITLASRTATNANGWNKTDVALSWSCADALSGPSSPTVYATVSTEGANQSATGTCSDLAGNSASNTQSSINIDKTAPTIALTSRTAANANGWNNTDVALAWSCLDALSGPVSTSVGQTVSTEGSGQTATGTCSDLAGNSASDTQSSINIDKTAPTIAFSDQSPAANVAGWNKTDVTFSWSCSDALSGAAASKVSATISTEGANQPVTDLCSDLAGNASTDTRTVSVDKTPPSIVLLSRTAANANGWNNTDVSLVWSCADSLSGPASPNATASVTTEGASQSASGTCSDVAGNTAADTVSGIKIDKTPPVISFTGQSPAKNAFGWNNTGVTLGWSCSDSLSGAAAPSVSQTVSTEGAAQPVTGVCTDLADNAATDTQSVSIDETAPNAPTVSVAPAPNAAGWNNGNVTVSFADNGDAGTVQSGIDACTGVKTISDETSGVIVGGTCKDRADNESVQASVTVKLDKTAPTITATATAGGQPYVSGTWTNNTVTVHFDCSDALSGLAVSCPADQTIAADTPAAGVSVSGSVSDVAGNSASTAPIVVKVDKTAPVISASASSNGDPYAANAWTNHDVTVTYACNDLGSGVASVSSPQTFGQGANQLASGSCTDVAGNGASASFGPIDVDETPPSISGSASPAPNAAGWNNTDVTVSFTCADQAALSGLKSCEPPHLLHEGDNQSVTGLALDNAGNSASATVSAIRIDETSPSIVATATTADGKSYSPDTWTNQSVTAHYECSDALSGIASGACPADRTISADTAPSGTSVSASVADVAGNTSSTAPIVVKVDKTAPLITASATAGGQPYVSGTWTNTPVTVHFDCSDALSGLAVSCPSDQTITGDTPAAGVSVSGSVSDVAGNTSSTAPVVVKVDQTAPVISASASSNGAAYAAGSWASHDVTVSYACTDALSGVGSVSAAQTFGEGANQLASGSCTDVAGNSAPAPFGPIDVDETPPTISGAASPAPNAAGWNNTDVTVSFTCADQAALSGLKSCEPPLLLHEGDHQSVTGSAADYAGNTASASVSGIRIDETPPSIVATATTADGKSYSSGTWTNQSVTVHYQCSDALSGIASGACPPDQTITADTPAAGTSVSASVADVAGNTGTSAPIVVKVDKAAPQISASASSNGAPYAANAWTNHDVMVSYSCSDGLSGVASVSAAQTFGQGANQLTSGSCTDVAGNSASAPFGPINVDKTAPTISGSASPAPNAAGWNNTDVTVSFTCADQVGLSGLKSCESLHVLHEGDAQSVTGSAADYAGNTASATVSGIRIDETPPSITATATTADGQPYVSGTWTNQSVTVRYQCSDALSGLASACSANQTLSAETPAAGTSVSASVADVAGNSSASAPIVVKIDKTAPTITATATAGGQPYVSGTWTNKTVTVHYSCSDALSGLAAGACPADQSISTDTPAAGTSVSGSVADVAGNTDASTPILAKVDKTAPTISPSATTADGHAYTSGTWTNQTVTVHYSCADTPSGLASLCPADQTVSADTPTTGTSLSASISDLAGNSTTSQAIIVKVDKTAPTLACAAPDSAWHANDVTLGCTATDGGSGLASSSDASFTLSTNVPAGTQTATAQTGTHTVCDAAGNCATAGPLGPAKIDKQAPATTATATLHATTTTYTFGSWTNTSVDVKLAAGDGAGSGVAQTYYSVDSGPTQTYSGPFTISGDANHSVSYWSVDAVGNTETAHSVHVQIDTTPPTIAASATTADGKPYTSGTWTNQTVTIHYTCADALSGVVSCPADDIVSADTPAAGQSFSHSISDQAGNSATSQAIVVKLDKTPPASSTSFPVAGSTYSAATWNAGCSGAGGFCGSATDALSGVAKVELSIQRVTGGLYWNGSAFAASGETFFTAAGTTSWSYAFAVGNFPADGSYAIHVRATDIAGNVQSSSAFTITISGVPAVTIKTPFAGQAIAFGSLANMTASFTDASSDSPWTCKVTWSDGQTSTGGISGKSQPFTCAASHSYSARGTYTIIVSVANKDGATGTAQVTISVT